MSTWNAEFGRRLRAARTGKGLTLQELAGRVTDKILPRSVSHQAVSRYEKGLDSPRFETACALADVLNVPVEALRPPAGMFR